MVAGNHTGWGSGSGVARIFGKASRFGYNHTLVQKSTGSVHGWGSNGYGQIGNGSSAVRVLSPSDNILSSNVKRLFATSMAIKDDGTVWVWGDNSSGQVGDGTNTNRSSPVQLNFPPAGSSIIRKTPATASTNASSVVYTVPFSQSVTGVDTTDFTLTTTGTPGGISLPLLDRELHMM